MVIGCERGELSVAPREAHELTRERGALRLEPRLLLRLPSLPLQPPMRSTRNQLGHSATCTLLMYSYLNTTTMNKWKRLRIEKWTCDWKFAVMQAEDKYTTHCLKARSHSSCERTRRNIFSSCSMKCARLLSRSSRRFTFCCHSSTVSGRYKHTHTWSYSIVRVHVRRLLERRQRQPPGANSVQIY